MLEPDIDGTMYWNLIFMEPCTKGKFRWNHVLDTMEPCTGTSLRRNHVLEPIFGTMYWNQIQMESCNIHMEHMEPEIV